MIAQKDREISISARVMLKRSVVILSQSQLHSCGLPLKPCVFLKFEPTEQVFNRDFYASSSEVISYYPSL